VLEDVRPADYLSRLAASDVGEAYKSLVAREMTIEAGNVVLDVGCGPGMDLARYAAAVGPGGQVVGVDHDPTSADAANTRTAHLPQVSVHIGDVHALALADRSVDRAHTDRVLQHVEDPRRAVGEIARALRRGGRAVFVEPDWDTLVIDHRDLAVSRRYTRFVTDRVFRHGAIGRQLPAMAAQVGLTVRRVVPHTVVFDDVQRADQMLGLKRVTARAVGEGVLSEASAAEWLDQLVHEPFFASATLFIVVADKAFDTD
jgi:ubiquinone/menaquinone biosynthesis C-methylase UbiE